MDIEIITNYIKLSPLWVRWWIFYLSIFNYSLATINSILYILFNKTLHEILALILTKVRIVFRQKS